MGYRHDDRATAWRDLIGAAPAVFTRPSLAIFMTLMNAWVLTPGRRTVTRMITVGDPEARRCHDAYHRFLRAGLWSMTSLWKSLAVRLVEQCCPTGTVIVDCDDTLFHKTGRKINGVGSFRDAIASTRRRVVYATGLNVVVITLRVRAPWGGEPLGLPVNCRLFRKGGPTHNDLAAAMIAQLAAWLPGRAFTLCADGAYASLAGRHLPRTQVCSRMRRDAAVYEAAPPRTGRRGRPATKGARLDSLEALAAAATDWANLDIDWRGRTVTRQVWSMPVLWYSVCPKDMILLVVVRDPAGIERDDYFFTTDLAAAPGDVASLYAGRWSIEDTFRATKQSLGGEDPQCWKHRGPERVVALSLWLHANVWAWYLATQGTAHTWKTRPWYAAKTTPSFADALACLRRTLWSARIYAAPATGPLPQQISDALIDILAEAA
ncbi:MAG: transposase [Actinomycetota bacterium]|nr:transposase [Actinomycetota bacterium]